jgi:peptidoglycan/xylan/chitin deacetylase (PgdA/CDA1 family)
MTEGRTGFAGGIVSLAFDDGWRSIYENALPILDGGNLKSTHYIVSRYLDHPLYMNAREVCDLERHGHDVGCHSVSHKHLPQQTLAIIEEEIAQSQRCLLDIGLPAQTFAYPYGEYDERVIDAVKRFGFKGARTGAKMTTADSMTSWLIRICSRVTRCESIPRLHASRNGFITPATTIYGSFWCSIRSIMKERRGARRLKHCAGSSNTF